MLNRPGVLAMFADPEASPVMPAIGTGAGHLAGVLDYELIRAHPELFTGFSNPTVLNKAIQAALLCRRGGR
jgi:muramoyltetrapeptide carboxypeptidase LdcA involved in peptidoglycan recycling